MRSVTTTGTDLKTLFDRRKAREWYYRKQKAKGKTVKPYKTYFIMFCVRIAECKDPTQ